MIARKFKPTKCAWQATTTFLNNRKAAERSVFYKLSNLRSHFLHFGHFSER
ncbi:hypothetical protein [Adhaeribacter arboris]|uniref:hypothetical protein n=1 Tax=Adhaeribacter arboris TaxID=2072846 RepID=UPI001304B404|nr:hypothetical protein [Adhaeribacter arboris]